jgi:peroxiredoxin family protein
VLAGEKRGLAVIFHSGSYDRLHHGLSIALAGLALGRPVRFFFTYWALPYLKRGGDSHFHLDSEAEDYRQVIKKNMEKGHPEGVSGLISQAKALGGKFYACTNSMSLLNIARDELIDEVDRSMGLTTFLTETAEDQILFI